MTKTKPANPKAHGKKATEAVVALRVNEVEELLIQGYSHAEILRYASEGATDKNGKKKGGWGVSVRQTETYIQRAYRQIESEMKSTRKRRTRVLLARQTRLYKKLYAQGDYKAASDPLKEIAKLGGNYAPVKHEVRDPDKMTKAEIQSEIAELMLWYEQHGQSVAGLAEAAAASAATEVRTSDTNGDPDSIGNECRDRASEEDECAVFAS